GTLLRQTRRVGVGRMRLPGDAAGRLLAVIAEDEALRGARPLAEVLAAPGRIVVLPALLLLLLQRLNPLVRHRGVVLERPMVARPNQVGLWGPAVRVLRAGVNVPFGLNA